MTDPDRLRLTLETALGVLALLNLYVTVRLLFYDGASAKRKVVQLVIIWLVPVVGALLVYSLIVVRPAVRREFYEPGDGPPGMGSDVGHH
jgi:hypothetical protein